MSTPAPRSITTQCNDLAQLILANFKTILYESRRHPDLKTAVEEAIKHISAPNPTPSTFSNDTLLRPLMMAMNFKLNNTIMPTLAIFQHLLELCPAIRVAQTAISSLSLLVDEQGGGGINPSNVNQNTSYTTGNQIQDDKIYVKILQCVLLAVTPAVLSDQEGLRSCFITALSICCKLSHKPRGMIQSTALAAVRHLIQLIFDVAHQDLTEQQYWTKYPFPHDKPPRHGQTALTNKLEQKKQMDEMTTHDMYLDDQLQSALKDFSDDSLSDALSYSSSLCSNTTSFLSTLSTSNIGSNVGGNANEGGKMGVLNSDEESGDDQATKSLHSTPELPKSTGNKKLQSQAALTPTLQGSVSTGGPIKGSNDDDDDDDSKSVDDDVVATHSNSTSNLLKDSSKSTTTTTPASNNDDNNKTSTLPTIPPKLSPLSPALSLALTIFSELCLTARSFLGNSTSSLQRVKSLVTPFISTLQPILCLELIHNLISKHNHIFISIPYFTRILSTDVLTTILEIIACENSQLVIWGIKIASVLLLHYGGIPSLTAQGELLATILSRQIYYTSSIPVLLAILDLYQQISSNARPLLILREVYDGSSTESTATTSATSISPVVYMFVKSIGALTLQMLELLCDNRIKLLPSSLRNDNLEFNSYTLPPTRSSEAVLSDLITGQGSGGVIQNGRNAPKGANNTQNSPNSTQNNPNGDPLSKFNDTQPLNQPYNAAQLFSSPYSIGIVNGVDLWDVRRAIVNNKTVPGGAYGTPLHILCVCLEILMSFCHTLSSLTQNLSRYEDYILPTFDTLVREAKEEEEQRKKLAELDLVVASWKDGSNTNSSSLGSNGELITEKSAEFNLDDFMSPNPNDKNNDKNGQLSASSSTLSKDSDNDSGDEELLESDSAQSLRSTSSVSTNSKNEDKSDEKSDEKNDEKKENDSKTTEKDSKTAQSPSQLDANGESIYGSIGDGYHVRCVTRLTRDLLQGEHTNAAFSFLTKFMSDLGYASLTPQTNESALSGSPSILNAKSAKDIGTPVSPSAKNNNNKKEEKNANIQPHYLSIMSCLSSLLTTPIIPTRRSLQSLLELLAPTLISAFHFTATYLKHQQLVQFCLLGLQSLVNVSVSLNGDGHILLADPSQSGTIIRKRIPSLVHSNSPTGNNPMHDITRELIIALCSLSLPIFDYSELLYLKTQYTMFGCNNEETLSSATGMYKYRATYKQPHGVINGILTKSGPKTKKGRSDDDDDHELIDMGGEDIKVSSTMNNQSIHHNLLIESATVSTQMASSNTQNGQNNVQNGQNQQIFTGKDAIWPPKAYSKTLSIDYMASVYEYIAPDIVQSILSRLETSDIPLSKPLNELAIFSPSQYVLPPQNNSNKNTAQNNEKKDEKVKNVKKKSNSKQSNHDLEYYPPPIPRSNGSAIQNGENRAQSTAFGVPTLADFFKCLSLNFCHIAALKAILNTAHVYGRELGQGWVPILHTLTRAYSIAQIWQSSLSVTKPVVNTVLDVTTYIAPQTVGELGAIVLATKALIDKNIKAFATLCNNPDNARYYTHDNHYKQYTKLAKIKAQRLFHLVFDENQNLVEIEQPVTSPSEPHILTLSPTIGTTGNNNAVRFKTPQVAPSPLLQTNYGKNQEINDNLLTYPSLTNHIIEIDPSQSYLPTDLHFNHIFHSLLLVNDLLHNRHILSLRPNPNITPVSWNIDHTSIVTNSTLTPTQLLLPSPSLLPGNDFGPKSSIDNQGGQNNNQQHSLLSPFADRINTFPLAFLLDLVEVTYQFTYLNPFIIFVRNVLMRLIYSDHHFTQRIGILFLSRLVCKVLKVESNIFSSKSNIFGLPNTSQAAPLASRQSIFSSKSPQKPSLTKDFAKSPGLKGLVDGTNGNNKSPQNSSISSELTNFTTPSPANNSMSSHGSMFLDASLYYYGKYSKSSIYLSPAAHERIYNAIKASKSVGGLFGSSNQNNITPTSHNSQFTTPIKPRKTPRITVPSTTSTSSTSLRLHEGHNHHAASGASMSNMVNPGKKDVIKGFGYTACDIFCYALASLCSPQPLQWYNHSATNVLSTVSTPAAGNGGLGGNSAPFTAIPSMMLDCALYALNCMSTVIDHCGGFINNNWLALLSPLSCSIAMLQQQQLYQQQLVIMSLPKEIVKKQSQYNNVTNQLSYGNSYGQSNHVGPTSPQLDPNAANTPSSSSQPVQQPVQQSSDVLMTARFKVVQLICDEYLDIIPLSYIPYIINIVSTYAQQFISINTAFVSVHQLWRLSDYIQQTCDAQQVNQHILLKLVDSLLYLQAITKEENDNVQKISPSSPSITYKSKSSASSSSNRIDAHQNVDYVSHPALFSASLTQQQQQQILPQNDTNLTGSQNNQSLLTPSITRSRTTTNDNNTTYAPTNPAANMITRLSITNTCNFPSLPYFFEKYMTFAPTNLECQHEMQPLQTHILSQIHSLLYNTTSNSNLAAQSPAVATRIPTQQRRMGGKRAENASKSDKNGQNAVIVELLDPSDEFSLANNNNNNVGAASPLDDISSSPTSQQINAIPELEPLPPPGESGLLYASQLSNTSLQLFLSQMLGHEGLYHHHPGSNTNYCDQTGTPTHGNVNHPTNGTFRGSILPTTSSNLAQIMENGPNMTNLSSNSLTNTPPHPQPAVQSDCSSASNVCHHNTITPQQQSSTIQHILEKHINYTKLSSSELSTHSSALQTLRESIYDYISTSTTSLKQYRKQWKLENPDVNVAECPIQIPSTYDYMTTVLNDLKYIITSSTSLFDVPYLEPSSPLSTMTVEESTNLYTSNQQRGLYNLLTTFMHTPSYQHSTQLHRNNVQSYHDILLYYIYYHFNFILRSNHTEIRHTAIKTLYKCFEEHFATTTPIMLEFTMMTLIIPYTMYVIPDTLVVHCENTTFPVSQQPINASSSPNLNSQQQNFNWRDTKILAIQGLTQLLNPLLLSLSKRCYQYNTTPAKNNNQGCIHHQSYSCENLFTPQRDHYDYQLINYQNSLFNLSTRQNSIPSNLLNIVSHILLNVLHHHNVDLAMATSHSIQLLFNSQYLMRCVEYDNTNQLLYTIFNLLSLYTGWVQRTAIIYSLTYIHSTAKDMGETLFQSIKAQYYPMVMGYEHILFTHPAQQMAQWILFHDNLIQQNNNFSGQNYSSGNATLGIPQSLIDIVYYTTNLSDRCVAWYSVALALLDFTHHIIKQPTAPVKIPGVQHNAPIGGVSPQTRAINYDSKSGKVSINSNNTQNTSKITTPLKQLALSMAKDIVSCEYLIPFVSTLNTTFINSICVRPNNDTSMLQNIYLYTLKDALGFGTSQTAPSATINGNQQGTPVQKPMNNAIVPITPQQQSTSSQQTPPQQPVTSSQSQQFQSEIDLVLVATVFECIASHLTSRPLQQYQSLGIYIDDNYKPGLFESYFNHPITPLPSATSSTSSLPNSQSNVTQTPRFVSNNLQSSQSRQQNNNDKSTDLLQSVVKSYPYNLISMGIPVAALQPAVVLDGVDYRYQLTPTTPLCPVYLNTIPQHIYQYNNASLQPQVQFPYPCVSWLLLSGQSYIAKLLTLTQAFLLSKIPSGLSLTQQASYQQQSPVQHVGETVGSPSSMMGQSGGVNAFTHQNNTVVTALLPNNFTTILPTTPSQRAAITNGQYLSDVALYSILFSYIRLFYPIYQKLLYICFTSNITSSSTLTHLQHTTDNGQQLTGSPALASTNNATSNQQNNNNNNTTNNLFAQLSTITLASNSYTRVTATHPLLRQLILKANNNPAGTNLPQQTSSGAQSPALPVMGPNGSGTGNSMSSHNGKFQFDTFYFLPVVNSLYINIESLSLFIYNFWPVFYQSTKIPTQIHVFKSHNVVLPPNIIQNPIAVYEAVNTALIAKTFSNQYSLSIQEYYTLPFLYTTYHIYNQLLNITSLPLPFANTSGGSNNNSDNHKLELCLQQLYVVISNGIIMLGRYITPLWLRAQLDIYQLMLLLGDVLVSNNDPHYTSIYANYASQSSQLLTQPSTNTVTNVVSSDDIVRGGVECNDDEMSLSPQSLSPVLSIPTAALSSSGSITSPVPYTTTETITTGTGNITTTTVVNSKFPQLTTALGSPDVNSLYSVIYEQQYHKGLIDTAKVKDIAHNFNLREDSSSFLLFFSKMWNLRLFVLSELALFDQFIQGAQPQVITTTTVTTVTVVEDDGDVMDGNCVVNGLVFDPITTTMHLPTVFPSSNEVDDHKDDVQDDVNVENNDDDEKEGTEVNDNDVNNNDNDTIKPLTPVKTLDHQSDSSEYQSTQIEGDIEAISPLSMGDDDDDNNTLGRINSDNDDNQFERSSTVSTEPNSDESDSNKGHIDDSNPSDIDLIALTKHNNASDDINNTSTIDNNNNTLVNEHNEHHEDVIASELTKKDFDVMSSTVTVTTESGEYIVIPRNPSGKLDTASPNGNKKSLKKQKNNNKNNVTSTTTTTSNTIVASPSPDSTPQNTTTTTTTSTTVVDIVHVDEKNDHSGQKINKKQLNRGMLFTPQIEPTPPQQQQQLTTMTPGVQSLRSSSASTAFVTPYPQSSVAFEQSDVVKDITQKVNKEAKRRTITTTTTTTTVTTVNIEPQFGIISQPQVHTLSILATYLYIQMVKHSISTYTYGCQYLTLLSSSQSTLDQMTHGLFSTLPTTQINTPYTVTPGINSITSSNVYSRPTSSSLTQSGSSLSQQQQNNNDNNVFNYHSVFFRPIPIPTSAEMEGVLYRVSQLSTSENTYNALTVQNSNVLESIGTSVPKPFQPHIIALYQHLCEVIISPDHEVRKIVLKLLLALRYKMGNGIF